MNLKTLSKLKPRERLLAIVTGVIAGLCLFYRAAVVPAAERLEHLREDVTLKTKQLAADRRSVAQRDAVLKAYERYAHLMQAVGTDEEETSKLLSTVADLAKAAGVTAVNLKPRPAETSGLAKRYQVEIETESTLEMLTRFVYAVEQSAQPLTVDRLDAKQEEKPDAPLKCMLRISRIAIP
ncbi:MAG: hypothetical protein A3C53_00015 [Omnitrophica WOR_2 bacterium RIFCSPHIGHO2_02_FULL_68_15]|nr:MAG: hypothetical protein A3C53_00015 [Omnitrophica WOR_2 bacterium RIFCSPHIGHO2_02_FULL_68_15]